MAYTYSQLEGIWLKAAQGTKYATQAWAELMAAIALAESGGNPNATNPTDNGGTQTSWGLWQISLGNHNAPAPNWNDPYENATLAIGKLDGQGLRAWGTYTSGAYKQYLQGGAAATLVGVAAAGSTPPKGNDLSTCVFQAPGFLFFSGPCFLTKGGVKWLSGAACLVAGGAMFGFGVVLLASVAGQSTGATDAVKKGARTLGIGASLLAGQPEVAGGIAATTRGGSSPAKRPAPRPTPERAAQLEESNRTARDILATTRPNNRGLSRERLRRPTPTGNRIPRTETTKKRDYERRSAARTDTTVGGRYPPF